MTTSRGQARPGSGTTGATRSLPRVYLAAVVLQAIYLGWIGAHGFPMTTADVVVLKQPAYMYLHTGVFSVPTFSGQLPHASTTFSAYPPLYTYLNLAVFGALGFGLFTSLGLDLLIHLVLSAMLGWFVLQYSGSQWFSALSVVLSSVFLCPVGRPEELGALLILAAIPLADRPDRSHHLASVLLGLSLATGLVQGIFGLALLAILDTAARGLTAALMSRVIVRIAGASLVALALCLPVALPDAGAALEQFRAATAFRYQPTLLDTLRTVPIWSLFFFPLFGLATALALAPISAHVRRHGTIKGLERLLAIAMALPVGVALNVAFRRPYYDFRLVGCLCLLVSLSLASRLLHERRPTLRRRLASRGVVAAMLGWMALSALVSMRNDGLVRYALAPLTWGEGRVRYADAARLVESVAPPPMTIGGDGQLWTTVRDGRPYLAVQWLGVADWPDAVVSLTFWGSHWGASGRANVLRETAWAERLGADYHELPLSNAPAACVLRVPLTGHQLQVSPSNCDWSVRIWRRRT